MTQTQYLLSEEIKECDTKNVGLMSRLESEPPASPLNNYVVLGNSFDLLSTSSLIHKVGS